MSSPYNLETPCCGAPVFVRLDNMFFDDEQERCPDCGDLATVEVSDDYEDDATVSVCMAEEPPDNWPHPYPPRGCDDYRRSPSWLAVTQEPAPLAPRCNGRCEVTPC